MTYGSWTDNTMFAQAMRKRDERRAWEAYWACRAILGRTDEADIARMDGESLRGE